MKHICFPVLLALAIVATVSAAPSVSGAWAMKVEGTPHGTMMMGLTLKQEGTKVTGKFTSGHMADTAVSGEFADGELKLETAGSADEKIVFTARMKDDGTLAGYLSSPVGDMQWTASRAEEEKK